MSPRLTVQVGSFSTEHSEVGNFSRSRILRLTGEQVGPRLEGAFAVVDAPPDEIQWICAALEAAFTVAISPGAEEDYVARVLQRFDRHGVSIVLTVWVGQSVVVASCHRSHAYLFRGGVLVDVAAMSDRIASDTSVRLTRFPPSSGDCLALVSGSMVRHVSQRDLQDTLSACLSEAFTAQDAAKWLTTLAAQQGDFDASALVIYFSARKRSGSGLKEQVTALSRAKPSPHQRPLREEPTAHEPVPHRMSLLRKARTLVGQSQAEVPEQVLSEARATGKTESEAAEVPGPGNFRTAPAEQKAAESEPTAPKMAATAHQSEGVESTGVLPARPELTETVLIRREAIARRGPQPRSNVAQQPGGAPADEQGAWTRAQEPLVGEEVQRERAEVIDVQPMDREVVRAEPIVVQQSEVGATVPVPLKAEPGRPEHIQTEIVESESVHPMPPAQPVIPEQPQAHLVAREALPIEPAITDQSAQQVDVQPIVPPTRHVEVVGLESTAVEAPAGLTQGERQMLEPQVSVPVPTPRKPPVDPGAVDPGEIQTAFRAQGRPVRQVEEARSTDRASVSTTEQRVAEAAGIQPRARRARGKLPLILVPALSLVLALMAASVYFFVLSAGSPHRATRPSASSKAVAPAPAASWRFPPLARPADQVILTLTNPNTSSVTVRVILPLLEHGGTTVQQEQIPAGGGAELTLDPRTWSAPVRIQASSPIIPVRVVMRHGRVRSSYGIRVASPVIRRNP